MTRIGAIKGIQSRLIYMVGKTVPEKGAQTMSKENYDTDPKIILYQCRDCHIIFPQTDEKVNKCPNCGKNLSKMQEFSDEKRSTK